MRDQYKFCCIFNYASHYREEIYLKIEKTFGGNFYFGNIENGKIRKIDYNLFLCKVEEFKTVRLFSHFVWIKGVVNLSFKRYRKYIMTGEYYNISTWFILIFNWILNKETYLWTHGWKGNESITQKIIKKVYYSLAKGLLLYGDRAKELMIKEGFSENKLRVIYNSLSYEKQLIIREKLVYKAIYKKIFKNDYPVILFTGRLTKVKKLDQLLKAQKNLIDEKVDINVVFVGDGEERRYLEIVVKELELHSYVYFFGECYDENLIASLYSEADMCVSPGNVGLTGIHAMTYGCPVISHNNFCEQMPEFEVIKEESTGAFFQQNDVGDLAKKIKNLLKIDRKLLRANCYNIIDQKFNTRYQIELLREVLS